MRIGNMSLNDNTNPTIAPHPLPSTTPPTTHHALPTTHRAAPRTGHHPTPPTTHYHPTTIHHHPPLRGRVTTLYTLHLPRVNNQGFDDNMEICSNISARVPNHQLVVPTADLFAAPPADSLEGAAELCASLLPSPHHR